VITMPPWDSTGLSRRADEPNGQHRAAPPAGDRGQPYRRTQQAQPQQARAQDGGHEQRMPAGIQLQVVTRPLDDSHDRLPRGRLTKRRAFPNSR